MVLLKLYSIISQHTALTETDLNKPVQLTTI